jgi:KDO2-lipid IV(A) lauroyltransferase
MTHGEIQTTQAKISWAVFLHPKYLFVGFGIVLLRLCVYLPYAIQMTMGRYVGRIAMPFASHRRHITKVNLQLCFSHLSEQQIKALLTRCFESAGMAIFESAIACWMSKKRLMKLFHFEGQHHLTQVLSKGKGALILTAHFTTLDIGGRILSLYAPYNVIYRKHKNPVFDWLLRKGREKHVHGTVARDDVRDFLKSFKKNLPIFYAADQDYGRKHSVFVPFFGVMAATITATSRITKIAQTTVLPYFVSRRSDNKGYIATLYPPLENFPTDDVYQDAQQINQLIERAINTNPEQYLWQHRRFKTRPFGETSPY